ncbi:hypothetical protein M153_2020009111 [Pseudoloma neurophilia]|uniref:Uncharacterized protein n=1 Tax=Pseudoloma neurophilia TaxID=146866 RepID=A0A0R0LZ56_9MICR|nr:hypothetical protein M153_2020009111 [Pseudoloma neurophilia]
MVPEKLKNTFVSILGKSRRNQSSTFKPMVIAKQVNEQTDLQVIKDIILESTAGISTNNEMIFINSSQSKCLKTKILGYEGTGKFVKENIRFMVFNSIRRDLIETLTILYPKLSQQTTCNRHKIMCVEAIPFCTKIAIFHLLNNHIEQLEEIKDEIQFVCDPLYLILFYKFWGNRITDNNGQKIFDCSTETETTNNKIVLKNQITKCDTIKHSIKSSNTKDTREYKTKKPLIEKTMSDLFKDNGLRYFINNDEQEELTIVNFDMAKYTRNYFSLRISQASVKNGTLFYKLQILLDQTRIVLKPTEIYFLYNYFNETRCPFIRIKIIQVITKVHNIENYTQWNEIIRNKVNFNGIYILSTVKLALLFDCLKYLIVHKLYEKEVEMFLYRSLYAICPDIVAHTLQLLRLKPCAVKQVIERCIKYDLADNLATDTLLQFIDRRTSKFAFSQMKQNNRLHFETSKTDCILKKIFSVSDDKFKLKIVKRYKFLAIKYHVLRPIEDKNLLLELSNRLIEKFDEDSIPLMADIMNSGVQFEDQMIYEQYFEKSMDILLFQKTHSTINDISNTKIESIKQNISNLMSLALKYGDIARNKKFFDKCLTKSEFSELNDIIRENLNFFDLVLFTKA